MKIVLDAGHGMDTPGKRSTDGSMREYQFNSRVAKLAKDILASYDVEVIFTHSDSRDVPLKERVQIANQKKADVFVSIHANAATPTAHGVETFVYKKTLKEAVKLATAVQNNILKIKGQRNRGVKEGNFAVVRDTNMTAILIEAGFMTNAMELAYLKSDSYRREVANAIVSALVDVYGLKKKVKVQTPTAPVKAPTSPQKASTVHRVIAGSYADKNNAVARVEYLKSIGITAFVEIKQQ